MAQVVQSMVSGNADSSNPALVTNLLQLLDKGSDVQLVFTTADKEPDSLPAHSQVLSLWSPVLSDAIEIARNSQTDIGPSPGPSAHAGSMIRIPMQDTIKKDWLLVMQFMYPVIPPPKFDWDVLETLLKVGDKYGMAAVLQRCGKFICNNAPFLDLTAGSKLFVWRWIFLTDKYRLYEAARACIDYKDVCKLMPDCPKQQLHELSGDSLQHLVIALSAHVPLVPKSNCTQNRIPRCTLSPRIEDFALY